MLDKLEGIGERLKLMLKQNRITQKEACELTGISKNAMSNYVNGNRIPESLMLYKLAKLFRTSMEWILTGEDSILNENPKCFKYYLRSTAEKIIIRYFNSESHNNKVLMTKVNDENKSIKIEEIATLLEMYFASEQEDSHLIVLPHIEYDFIINFKQLSADDKQALSEFVNTKLCLSKKHCEDININLQKEPY